MHKKANLRKLVITATAASSMMLAASAIADHKSGEQEITLIHVGDFHGQMEPSDNTRSDNRYEVLEGGLARVMTKIKQIRRHAEEGGQTHFTFMAGDTTHGSIDVTYTKGDAILRVVNKMGIDLFAPGNWDFVYGTCRTHEMWNFNSDALAQLNAKPQIDCTTLPGGLRANFKTLAANAYVDNDRNSANCPPAGSRTRLFDAWKIMTDPRTGLKLGVIGFTTERGPRVIGNPVVEGLCFTKGDEEIVELVQLMNEKRAAGEINAVIMVSELNLANNRRVVDLVDDTLGAGGIDLVLSADMHEETPRPIYTKNGVPMVAQGQDGQNIGEIELEFRNGKLKDVEYRQHRITPRIREDAEIADIVAEEHAPFVDGSSSHTHFVHGRTLPRDPADPSKTFNVEQPLAIAGIDINRSNFSHQENAAVIEGSGHKMITDGMRHTVKTVLAKKMAAGELDVGGSAADLCESHDAAGKCTAHYPVISVIRGFRYTTSVRAGHPITLETLFHFTPIGPYVAAGVATGAQIRGMGVPNNAHPNAGGIEHSAFSSLGPDVGKWGGGWVFNWTGLKYDLNPYASKDHYTANIMVGTDAEGYSPLNDGRNYIVVGYSFDKFLFNTTSGAPELQFINKPFKPRFVTPNIYRVTYTDAGKSTLDSSNALDLVGTDFRATYGAANSMTVVDTVARYVMNEFGNKGLAFTNTAPAIRTNLLCPFPDMRDVRNTASGVVLDPAFPIVDIGFSMMQPIFGGNKNLIQYLSEDDQATCAANGVF